MSVKINSFGGPLIWFFRKYYSNVTSKIMLKFVSNRYSKTADRYIRYFLSQDTPPLFQNVMLETINRCNGTCEFCPASKYTETRPYMKMPDEIYYKIIRQLKDIGWSGKLFMCVNNEPFMDKRIMEFSKYAKETIPGVSIAMISNGTLLTIEKMDAMAGIVDQIVINDYSEKYALSDTHRKIYQHIKGHPDRFASMNIVINRRYSKEVLATRAGNAPNKPIKNVEVNCPCVYPFTDLIIFPNGKVGICCNDCKEITDFGDVNQDSLIDIWKNDKFQKLRQAMTSGRMHYKFCEECDVLDAGERERYITELMRELGKEE